jgi:hypothetical protein
MNSNNYVSNVKATVWASKVRSSTTTMRKAETQSTPYPILVGVFLPRGNVFQCETNGHRHTDLLPKLIMRPYPWTYPALGS